MSTLAGNPKSVTMGFDEKLCWLRADVTTDQQGRQTSFQYDDMGRLVTTSYPDATVETSTYDAEGRRLTSTDRAGRTTLFDYDELGRLTKATYVDGALDAIKCGTWH